MNKLALLAIILLLAGGSFFYVKQRNARRRQMAHMLIIGTSADFKPFSFRKESGIEGFDIDIIREIAKRLHKEPLKKDMPFELLIPQLQLGTIHVVAAGMTPTAERAERVLFTKPHLVGDTLVILTKKENPITSLEDLKGKKVIVNQGYTADRYMSSIKGPELVRLPSVSDALLALRSNKAFAFVVARRAIQPYFDQHGAEEFTTFTVPDSPEESSALVISPHYPLLAQQIDKLLTQMEEDGTLKALKEKWSLV
jgi:arginine/lysine/histidine transporter system substrate-binding protein